MFFKQVVTVGKIGESQKGMSAIKQKLSFKGETILPPQIPYPDNSGKWKLVNVVPTPVISNNNKQYTVLNYYWEQVTAQKPIVSTEKA
tara:strand:+ start:116 stop:379 length:264 start_codon:yes stop_codon:yes gene_type:complete